MLSRCTSEATYHHERLIDVTWGQGLMDKISYMRGTFSEQSEKYFEEVQTKTGASAKADALLKLYDQKTRKLTIQNAFGDVRVRAGSAVVVALNLGDIVTNNYMVVNKVTHTFRGDEHMMELDLIGGEFIA